MHESRREATLTAWWGYTFISRHHPLRDRREYYEIPQEGKGDVTTGQFSVRSPNFSPSHSQKEPSKLVGGRALHSSALWHQGSHCRATFGVIASLSTFGSPTAGATWEPSQLSFEHSPPSISSSEQPNPWETSSALQIGNRGWREFKMTNWWLRRETATTQSLTCQRTDSSRCWEQGPGCCLCVCVGGGSCHNLFLFHIIYSPSTGILKS